ncbi:hypothetical protein RD792_001240 [Penstemon davidsonii]|uniref:non-specific serine/threonine protein kinase n=1 Tax=Penstemon davidsonii TaxID=160366 RepID=A0ABR0DP19_9LAMI|nr:hypothetical protein RD792_001240 [Penstemon davidsonii]
MVNTTLDYSLFDYTDTCTNLTFLYGCPSFLSFPEYSRASCIGNNNVYVFPGNIGPGECNASVIVPVLVSHHENEGGGSVNVTELNQSVLLRGFDVRWKIDSKVCNDCTESMGSQPFHCGNLRDISYPFWGGNNRPVSCGYPGFDIDCEGETPILNISSVLYRVLEINNSTQTLRIARQDLWNNYCPTFLYNTTLNYTLFDFSSNSNDQNITLFYGCSISQPQPIPIQSPYQLSCDVNQTTISGFYLTGDVSDPGIGIGCRSRISVPVNEFAERDLSNVATASLIVLQSAFRSGFWIDWAANNSNCENCVESGGVCGYNQDTASFACYCADGSREFTCSNNTQNGTYN